MSRLFKTDLQSKLKKDLHERLERERMQREFPFHPQTNEWNFRDREDVLTHLQQKETERRQKLAVLQQQREQEISDNTPSSPTITPYSRSLTFEQPFHVRLYSTPRSPNSSHSMHVYDPEELEGIRRRSRKGNPDFEKLYEDALIRRVNQEQAILRAQHEQNMQSNSKKIRGKSLELLSTKSDKTLQKMTNLVWEAANGTDIITKEILADVLRAIGFFRITPGTDTPNKVRAVQEEKSLRKLCIFLQTAGHNLSANLDGPLPPFILPPPSPIHDAFHESPHPPPFSESPIPLPVSTPPPPPLAAPTLPPDSFSLPPPPPLTPPPATDLPLPPPPITPSSPVLPVSLSPVLPPTTPSMSFNDSILSTPVALGNELESNEIRASDAIDFLSVILKRCLPTDTNKKLIEDTTQPLSVAERLIRRFISLYQTARAYDTTQNLRSPSPPKEEYSFRPKINNKSVSMDSGEKEGPSRYEKLYMMSSAIAEKRARAQEEGEKKKTKGCTFTPQVNDRVEKPNGMKKSEALFNMSKSKKKWEDQTPTHLAKELKHCSFQPNLNSTRESLEYLQRPPPEPPRGVEQFDKRLKQAQQAREELQQMLERPSYPKPSALHAKPPSFLTTRAKPAWEPPLLYVDIKLAHGRTGRVGIHRGDDPKVLAQNFANAFHLESKLTAKLEEMLRQHIQNLENVGTEEAPEDYNGEGEDGENGEAGYGSAGENGGEHVHYKEGRGYHSDH